MHKCMCICVEVNLKIFEKVYLKDISSKRLDYLFSILLIHWNIIIMILIVVVIIIVQAQVNEHYFRVTK